METHEVDLRREDYDEIISINGAIQGYSNTVKYTDLHKDIFEHISKEKIKNASRLITSYGLNPDFNFSVFDIGYEVLGDINGEVLFRTYVDDSIAKDEIQYSVILFGL